jgi:hypothetical protein
MRRTGFALLLLVLCVTVIASLPVTSSADPDPGVKCTCTYPDTGELGVIKDDDCIVQHCWVPIGG